MRIKYHEILIETTDSTLTDDVFDKLIQLIKCDSTNNVSNVLATECYTNHDVANDANPDSTNVQRLPERMAVVDRERLPNDYNVIREAKCNESVSYFRCPSCGQSAIINIDGVNVLRDIQIDNLEEQQSYILDADYNLGAKLNYEEAKNHITSGGEIMNSNDYEGFCLNCMSCTTTDRWVEAFESPLAYFEFEKPCPLCGGETVMSVNQEVEKRGIVTICDREQCGYVLQ